MEPRGPSAHYAATELGEIESPDGHEVIQDVARQLDSTPDDARRLTKAVLVELDAAEPGLVVLPAEVRAVLEA